MVLGMSLAAFTTVHVIISLVAIASGIVVLIGMLRSQRMPLWTALFLLMTVLTSVTGYLFPIHGFTPAQAVGAISLVLLAIAIFALYGRRLSGSWRWIYVLTAAAALWFNIFVLIVQSFQKVTFLNPLAPQVGPPFSEPQNTQFMIAQAAALVIMIVLGLVGAFKFHPGIKLAS
jgi:hypothetical protein